MIDIDGAKGGGQILRSALTLSMVTGQAFRITNIRGQRPKPGLKRQHLASVQAAVAVSSGAVDGAVLDSTELVFSPGEIQGGDYQFTISTAGSTMLVLQTVLLALLRASKPSRIRLSGGTHNPMAPTFDFVTTVYLPQLAKMGARVQARLIRHGFAPAGGGQVGVEIEPSALNPLELVERGDEQGLQARILSAHVEAGVAKREAAYLVRKLEIGQEQIVIDQIDASDGPGNVLMISAVHQHVAEMATAFGERGRSSESVAREVINEWRRYSNANTVVGRRLADQLLLPMAFAGGRFLTLPLSNHSQTNLETIRAFLPELEIVVRTEGSHTVEVVMA